ncbi:MAG: O-antigen ligase family protein [Actinomycetota bacterium]|nr:O-antigen ligase family protein [Actinomycetota bacterium]
MAWLPVLDLGPWPVEAAAALIVGLPGVPLLVARGMGRASGRPPGERWAARAMLAWLAAGLASALMSVRPGLSMVGLFDQGTGWLFMVVLGGAWALGTALGPAGRRLVGSALIVGAVANALVAIAQLVVGLSSIGLPGYGGGQPIGFQGNPVFLGGIEAGTLVVLATRFADRPGRVWLSTGLVAIGVGASGERLSMLVALVLAVGSLAVVWIPEGSRAMRAIDALRDRGPNRSAAAGTSASRSPGRSLGSAPAATTGIVRRFAPRRPWRRASTFAGLVVGGLGVGVALPLVRASSVVARQLTATAEGTFGDRLHAWFEGGRALLHAPALGYGPGQFESATSALFPQWFARTHPGQVFTDAHNIGVEYAVTTGLVGLACLVVFAVFAVRGRRGPLLGFAAVALAVELVEPLNPVLTPLLFLAAGGASWSMQRHLGSVGPARSVDVADPLPPADFHRRRLPRAKVLVVATCVAGLIGLAGAADLLVGVTAMSDAHARMLASSEGAALADARLAQQLLPPWPQPPQALAVVELLGRQASPSAPTPLELAARWDQVAAARDPGDAAAWLAAAGLQLELRHLSQAHQDALVALRSYPWGASTLQLLGTVALDQHRLQAARRWFSLLVQVQPHPGLAALMRGQCGTGMQIGYLPTHRTGCGGDVTVRAAP